MKVLLTDKNPHPFPGAPDHLYADWWGREIEISHGRSPKEEHKCGTVMLWRITGPKEFVSLLAKNNCGLYICACCIASEVKRLCPNGCGRRISELNMRQHVEACSSGEMSADTKQDYVVRLLANGKTLDQIATELDIEIGTVRQKLNLMKAKWGASTTEHLMVMLAHEGQV